MQMYHVARLQRVAFAVTLAASVLALGSYGLNQSYQNPAEEGGGLLAQLREEDQRDYERELQMKSSAFYKESHIASKHNNWIFKDQYSQMVY